MDFGVFVASLGLVVGSACLGALLRSIFGRPQHAIWVLLRSIFGRPQRAHILGRVLWDCYQEVHYPSPTIADKDLVVLVNSGHLRVKGGIRNIIGKMRHDKVDNLTPRDFSGENRVIKLLTSADSIINTSKVTINRAGKTLRLCRKDHSANSDASDVQIGIVEAVPASVVRLSVKSLPDISRACVERHFSCYRSIIPWVTMKSRDMGFILNDVLPECGPISSIDLGSVLAQLVSDYRVSDMKLPILTNTNVNGQIYLHFDSMKLETINITICKLLGFDGFVGASLDPSSMIKAAASVGAPTIAANEASAIFREQLGNMIKVETVLTGEDQDLISRERCHVRYLQKFNVTNDHPLMAAYREIIRHDFEHMVNLRTTRLRTLVLGASSREIRYYNNNVNVFFQLALREGKDMNRFLIDCLTELKDTKLKSLSKKKIADNEDILRRAQNAVVSVNTMIEEWRDHKRIPARFMLWDESFQLFKGRMGGNNFDTIVFQDVGYNYDEKDWLDIFRSTGANTGYGYMCLPWELIEPKLLSSSGYVFRTDGKESKLAYYGYSNGYVHNTNSWSTLMRNPVMVEGSFSIIVEFVARIGPMTCIRLSRTTIVELHVRNLEVPEYLRTVQVLDIVESFNSSKQELDLKNLVYFPVKASEFHDVVNYALDVAKESINFNTILLYIRRRCSGISLVTRDIAKSWTAPKQKLPAFALVVFLYTNHMINDFVNLQDRRHMILPSKFRLFLRRLFTDSSVMEMFRTYYEYFLQQDLFHILVKDVDHSFWQERWAKGSGKDLKVFNEPNPEDLLAFSDDESIIDDDCMTCLTLKSVCGGQIFTCNREVGEIYQHDFCLNNDELTRLRANLSDNTKDHPGIKHVKELALSKVPPSVFSHSAIVYYICGPPGTGKSYIIRAMARRDDLVITPFARLKQDYTNFVHPITKQKTSLRCHTQHAAFAALNHPRIFVDEYTAMPYEFLATIVFNCAAEEVYLVGDHRQISLINEVEGLAITAKIDLTKLRSHELIRNYRNPKDAVFVLNTIYLYNMVNMKDFNGFKFDYVENYNVYEEYTPLFFRHSTAERFGIDSDTCQKVTVRSNQGATYYKVKLVVTDNDKDVFNIPSMAIVALSRHTDECVILHENSSISNTFVEMLKSGILAPRVASLPKLSPVCNIFNISEGLDNHDREQMRTSIPTDDRSTSSGFGEDERQVEEEVGGNNVIPPVKEIKKKYKLRWSGVSRLSAVVVGFSSWSNITYYASSVAKFVYNVMIYIRDFNLQTVRHLLYMLLTFIRVKIVSLLFEEYVEEVIDPSRSQQPKTPPVVSTHNVYKSNQRKVGVGANKRTKVRFDDQVRREQGHEQAHEKEQQHEGSKDKDHSGTTKTTEPSVASEVFEDISNEPTLNTSSGDTNNVSDVDVESTSTNEQTTAPCSTEDNDNDLRSLPDQNVCMIQALADLTGNDINDVWHSMLVAVGKDKAKELYNHTWSTDEMQMFCYLNNLTVTVVLDDKENIGCVYGTGLNHIGIIDFSSEGVGHFYVKNVNKVKNVHFKLITKEDDLNISERRTEKLFITHDMLRQMSSSGNTLYNLYIYDAILNYMRDGSLEHMIGGESAMLNDIGFSDAILIKGDLPPKYNFYKRKQTEPDLLEKIKTRFSKPLLIIDMGSLTMKFVVTEPGEDVPSGNVYRPLSKFLKSQHLLLSGFDRFVAGFIVPRDLKHLTPTEIKEKMKEIVARDVRRLKSKSVFSGGTVQQVRPFTTFPALKAKSVEYIPLQNAEEGFKEMARLFVNPVYLNDILVEDEDKTKDEYVPIENTSFDAFRMLFEDMATIDEFNFELTNQEALGYLDKDFGGGVFNLTAFDNLNQKYKPLKQTENAWSLLNVAPGVTYFKSHLTQSLFCLQMRYLTKAFISTHNVQSIDKAREIAELFFYEHMELNFDIFNEQDIYQTVLESEKAMEEKHYDKQTDFELSGDTIVRFSMKDIFKPFKTSIDLFKPGQGISAWSKNLQTIFQTSFRIINKHFINCLSPNVVFDNGMDEYSLMVRVNGLLKLLPDIAINGVIDATACDSGQNKFTQMIERVILEKLGINDYFLDWYYSHREEYVLKGYHVTANVEDIKTSGEPATLLNNTILMACLMNYLIRGDGPSVLVIKGDDGLKRQLNLRCNDAVLPLLKNYLKMDFKIDINVPITFCGYFLSGSNLVPDVVRKCFKIAGHRFRDHEHFCEYQQSLRDWVLTVNRMDVAYVCSITATNYGLTYEFVSNLFESIVSLTHINERQFKSTFKFKKFNWVEDYEHSTPWKEKLPWFQGYH